jgi:hypothetical protein
VYPRREEIAFIVEARGTVAVGEQLSLRMALPGRSWRLHHATNVGRTHARARPPDVERGTVIFHLKKFYRFCLRVKSVACLANVTWSLGSTLTYQRRWSFSLVHVRWGRPPWRAARFENLVAAHLLKLCHLLQDAEGHAAEPHYLRDRAGREVDFLVTLNRKPWFAVEAKLSETRIDPALFYHRQRLPIPWTYQVLLEGERDFIERDVRCLPAAQFLAGLV